MYEKFKTVEKKKRENWTRLEAKEIRRLREERGDAGG